jgi:heme/copper-type cytochrome/quinol oxidase subunit 2
MDHGFMPIVVEVRSRDDFAEWLTEMGATAPAFAEQDSDDSSLRTAFNE